MSKVAKLHKIKHFDGSREYEETEEKKGLKWKIEKKEKIWKSFEDLKNEDSFKWRLRLNYL